MTTPGKVRVRARAETGKVLVRARPAAQPESNSDSLAHDFLGVLGRIADALTSLPAHVVNVLPAQNHVHVDVAPTPIESHNHVVVEARKPTPMRAVPQRDGSRIYVPIEKGND